MDINRALSFLSTLSPSLSHKTQQRLSAFFFGFLILMVSLFLFEKGIVYPNNHSNVMFQLVLSPDQHLLSEI